MDSPEGYAKVLDRIEKFKRDYPDYRVPYALLKAGHEVTPASLVPNRDDHRDAADIDRILSAQSEMIRMERERNSKMDARLKARRLRYTPVEVIRPLEPDLSGRERPFYGWASVRLLWLWHLISLGWICQYGSRPLYRSKI